MCWQMSSMVRCGSNPVFDLGEGLLDRIEVGRIGRQIPESCATALMRQRSAAA